MIDLAALLRSYRLPCGSEAALQDAIAELLNRHGVPFEREYRLNAHDRLDFFVDGAGVEVKINGSLPALIRQLHRYAQHDSIRDLVVVTTRPRLTQVPHELAGKPVHVVSMLENAL